MTARMLQISLGSVVIGVIGCLLDGNKPLGRCFWFAMAAYLYGQYVGGLK
jgi:hypothetical protein